MSYQALYRVWRPDTFDGVVGQDLIVTTLRNQIFTGRIAHAYLFCGSRGTGKTSMAKLFARAINCVSSDKTLCPCGICEPCVELKAENNMDVIEIDAASNNGVDEIRDLREKVKYPPSIGRYKVYIIDEVHMLSTGAFNALLKTLEEPPEHAVFILATTEPQRLPATILSRCQRFDFKRIPADTIVALLKKIADAQGADAEERALYAIARSAQGGMRDAIGTLDLCLSYAQGALTYEVALTAMGSVGNAFLFDFADALIGDDLASAFKLIGEGVNGGRDAMALAREIAAHLRSLLIAKFGGNDLPELLDATREDAALYTEQAARASHEKLLRMMELFMRAEGEMRWFSQPRTMLELCAARASRPDLDQDISALAERIDRLEKRIEAGVPVISSPAPQKSAPPPAKETQKKPPAEAPPPRKTQADSEDLGLYKKAQEAIQAENSGLKPLLDAAEFLGRDEDAILLHVPKSKEIFAKILFGDAKKKIVEDALSQVYGRRMTIRESVAAAPPSKKADKDNLLLAFEVFGRENVVVQDDE